MMHYSVNDTGKLGKRNSEFSQQESNLRPSDYQFGCSEAIKLGRIFHRISFHWHMQGVH